MRTQVLRGRIEPLALVDVLAYLGRTQESGILNATKGNIRKSIVINEGDIVFARSNQVENRLGDMLLAEGVITKEQYDQGTALIYEKGIRHGRALVEIGAISPKMLWSTIRKQIQAIAHSMIPWTSGYFEFIKREIRQKESITLKLSIFELVLGAIRMLEDKDLFLTRFGDMNQIYVINEFAADMKRHLEPHEAHLLSLIDGKRTVSDICEHSDYGMESLRVVYLLRLLGMVHAQGEQGPPTHPMIINFNRVFSYVHEYLTEHVGRVGANLLHKYFDDIRVAQPDVFNEVGLLKDGRLNPLHLQRNIRKLQGGDVTVILDEAMNEYLNMCILAVKKVLGSEHETIVVKHISEMD